MSRALPDELLASYELFFESNIALSKLKDDAFGGRLFSYRAQKDTLGIPGRSMAWKLFLLPAVPAPLSPPPEQTSASPPLESLRSLRQEYTRLALEHLKAPDGGYEDDLALPGVEGLKRAAHDAPLNLELNNPLSLHADNPWKEWFSAVELRKTIHQDVQRTFPDHEYFQSAQTQSQLTQILYVYSVTHPDIGYRQGMHELLAPLYHAIDFDSVQQLDTPKVAFAELCARSWVAADAWALFDCVMAGMGVWYEWREPSPPALPAHLSAQWRHGTPDPGATGQVASYVAPIVLACQRLQAQMLKAVDPLLWSSMQKTGVEPQIYGIRWIRLLFTREFNLADSMILWDGLFSCDDPFALVLWICVAMLVRIRTQLIPADYSNQLMLLLRYPAPPASSADPDSSLAHHATLLLRQAFALSLAPNPSTGSSLAIENRNLLQIPLEMAGPSQAPARSRPTNARRASIDAARGDGNGKYVTPSGASRSAHSHQLSQGQLGLPEMLARGLLDKGESLGINKTVMNAVSEIRKNIPDFTAPLLRSPSAAEYQYPAFPLVGEKSARSSSTSTPSSSAPAPPVVVDERPPWEHRTRLEMEAEIAQLKALQRTLGDAVALAVDALLQDEEPDNSKATSASGSGSARDLSEEECLSRSAENTETSERIKRIRERKREAVEGLAHVRDLLQDSTTEIDEVRLYGEEEYRKRLALKRAKNGGVRPGQSPKQAAKDLPPAAALKPPEPVRVAAPVSARAAQAEGHRRQKSTPESISTGRPPHPIATLPRSPQAQPSSPFSMPFNQSQATMTRRASPGSASTSVPRNSPFPLRNQDNVDLPMQAPWNYTRSSFSAPFAESAGMPRLPPRSSGPGTSGEGSGKPLVLNEGVGSNASLARPQIAHGRKASGDPLGALSLK